VTASLDQAIEDYLTYLRVERGVADATIQAYRADLADCGQPWRGSRRASGLEVAQRLAARAADGPRPGLPDQPAPAGGRDPGFYRFAHGDGLIGVDVAAHLSPPGSRGSCPRR
jgi:site-specific recombinase XerC